MRVNIEVNDKQIEQAFTAVTREQKKMMKRAYRKATSIIVRTARKNMKSAFRSLVWRKGGNLDLRKGIRTSIYKDASGASVYERSPRDLFFILLFHDYGAKNGRKKGKHPRKTNYVKKGGIKEKGFFQSAFSKIKDAESELIKSVETDLTKMLK